MNLAPPPPPPVPVSGPAVGSVEWGCDMVARVLPAGPAQAVKVCVVHGGEPFPSLHRARAKYCELAIGSGWEGWEARMVWDCIVAILKPLENDDIPF